MPRTKESGMTAEELWVALQPLTEGFAAEVVHRIEAKHDELQALGLSGATRNYDEDSRKVLSTMATDAVYLAAYLRELWAKLERPE